VSVVKKSSFFRHKFRHGDLYGEEIRGGHSSLSIDVNVLCSGRDIVAFSPLSPQSPNESL